MMFTLKAFTDEYVTQTGVTATATVTGISGLQYIKAFNDSEQQQSYTSSGARLYDMKIYNGVTSTDASVENTKLLGLNGVTFSMSGLQLQV